MLTIIKLRSARKKAKEMLRHARHLLNMRGDIMSPADVATLQAATDATATVVKGRNTGEIEKSANSLFDIVCKMSPQRSFPSLRENIEVVVVAIAVAMAFRTYYLQPFKIPTGSMEPTLFGIHSTDDPVPGFMDRTPLKFAKWIITGQMHHRITVKGVGVLSMPQSADPFHPASLYYHVGSKRYRVPKYASLDYTPGQFVPDGATLWSGTITAGDHVFVNKVAWNFRRPKRGEIMVFSTNGIQGIQPNTHYIKRLAATPGETVSIHPPALVIDGTPVDSPQSILRIVQKQPGYHGYQVTPDAEFLGHPGDSFHLGEGQYFALGDNTMNSRDGRYWGYVPAANLVGPAALIYWPLSRRWGLTR